MPRLQRLSRNQYLRLQAYRATSMPHFSGRTKATKEKKREKWLAEEADYKAHVEANTKLINEQMDDPGTVGHIGGECLMMDSSSIGQRVFLPVGPRWSTIKTLEEVLQAPGMGRPLSGSAPSNFKHAQYVWVKPRDDQDKRWEELQDQWDLENRHAINEITGRRDFQYEKAAEAWVASRLGMSTDATMQHLYGVLEVGASQTEAHAEPAVPSCD